MLQAPQVHAVFWGPQVAAATQTAITTWFGDLAQSPIVPMLGQYDTASPAQFITPMHFAGSVVDADAPAQTTISDQDIQVELTRMIDAGTVPANDGNQLYVMYFPPGATIASDSGTLVRRVLRLSRLVLSQRHQRVLCGDPRHDGRAVQVGLRVRSDADQRRLPDDVPRGHRGDHRRGCRRDHHGRSQLRVVRSAHRQRDR